MKVLLAGGFIGAGLRKTERGTGTRTPGAEGGAGIGETVVPLSAGLLLARRPLVQLFLVRA